MDANLQVSIVGIAISLLVQLFTFAFFSGRISRGQENLQADFLMAENDRKGYQRHTNDRLDDLEEKHDTRYLAVDREIVKVSTNMGGFEREIKELKETIKDFTREIKELVKEMKK